MKTLAIAVLLCLTLSLFAQKSENLPEKELKEVVVLGSKFPEEQIKSAKSTYLIDSAEIAVESVVSFAEYLNEIPGLSVRGLGGKPGTVLSLFSRNLGMDNITIMIDGIPLVDPSMPSAVFDLRFLGNDQPNSVETVHSGLGSLYGSGASGSVINISTRGKSEKGVSGTASLVGGSFATYGADVSAQYNTGKITAGVDASVMKSRGFSSALEASDTINFDLDGFRRESVRLFTDWNITEKVLMKGGLEFADFYNEFDAAAFTDGDQSETANMKRAFMKVEADFEKLLLSSIHSLNNTDREYFGNWTSKFTGKELYNEIILQNKGDEMHWLAGLQSRLPSMFDEINNITHSSSRVVNTDVYLNGKYKYRWAAIHGGARANFNENYGNHLVYNINPSAELDFSNFSAQLFYQYSTSFLAPSPSQLYGYGGNVDLMPERGMTEESGLKLEWKKFNFQFTGYSRNIDEAIYFIPAYQEGGFMGGNFENVNSDVHYKGYEISLSLSDPRYNIDLSFSNNKNGQQGENPPAVRTFPEKLFHLKVLGKVTKNISIYTKFNYTEGRHDFDWYGMDYVDLDAFLLWNSGASYQFKQLKLDLSFRNILNEEYMETYGYQTAGFNWTSRLTYQF